MFKLERLSKYHKKENFNCGDFALNEFLKKYAFQNQKKYYVGITYVIIDNENNIVAYITLSGISIKKTILKEKYPY